METMGPIMATAFRELVLSPLEMLSRRADAALLTSSEELAKQASRRMDATQAMTTGHVAAATVIASPLAGACAGGRRARESAAGGEITPRIWAPVMWRHPHPNPPPQAQGYRI